MAKRRATYSVKAVAAKYGFRSGLEMTIDESLKSRGIDGEYEKHIIQYTKPETHHKYHPDFKLPNGIFVETKGRFLTDDRKKHILIKAQNPNLDIRFLFQNSKTKISKASKTTYADWCIKHGFKFADKDIPDDWLI
jgi:hypothetical protein